MTRVAYEVTPSGDQWLVTRDGQPGMSYVSQEAAYEVACSEAAGDLRIGHAGRSNPTDVIAQPTTLPAMRRYSDAVLRMEEHGAGQ